MEKFDLVIAGGGLAGARTIASYREAGGAGSVALLAAEGVLPYHRPSLSKKYLRGERTETPFVENEDFYAEHAVDVFLETPVVGLDTDKHAIAAAGHVRLGYDRLLIATGASPRRLPVPGADLVGVHTLRTVHDSTAIRHAAQAAQRAVVVGGGFIGMEVAASLRALGLDVTLIDIASGLFAQLRNPVLSEQLAALYRGEGIDVWLEESVAAFEGASKLEAVTTQTGRRVEADLAVVGVGVVPNVDFLADSGIAVDNGVLVDERYRTNVPGVYAVGDVANVYDPLFARRRRIEHWSNANYQGGQVGTLLAGGAAAFDDVSTFFTEVFGRTLKVFGDVSDFDDVRNDGALAEDDFLATYTNGGRLVGAIAVGQSEEREAELKELIARQASPRPRELAA